VRGARPESGAWRAALEATTNPERQVRVDEIALVVGSDDGRQLLKSPSTGLLMRHSNAMPANRCLIRWPMTGGGPDGPHAEPRVEQLLDHGLSELSEREREVLGGRFGYMTASPKRWKSLPIAWG
jgi:hypothetical protein